MCLQKNMRFLLPEYLKIPQTLFGEEAKRGLLSMAGGRWGQEDVKVLRFILGEVLGL